MMEIAEHTQLVTVNPNSCPEVLSSQLCSELAALETTAIPLQRQQVL